MHTKSRENDRVRVDWKATWDAVEMHQRCASMRTKSRVNDRSAPGDAPEMCKHTNKSK